MRTIKPGDTLTARSLCDHECIFSAEILQRRGRFVTIKAQGLTRNVMVRHDADSEYIFALGQYSMAPIFRAI